MFPRTARWWTGFYLEGKTLLFIGFGGRLLGILALKDSVRAHAAAAIARLTAVVALLEDSVGLPLQKRVLPPQLGEFLSMRSHVGHAAVVELKAQPGAFALQRLQRRDAGALEPVPPRPPADVRLRSAMRAERRAATVRLCWASSRFMSARPPAV
ncbi:hypothetical protein SAMN06265338_13612 [Rhodoblastus acidophilus]|uniref:Uncharacterized protein n=1 Tax=Rhodoblastus acidophilus TaxID=1074 RepID=A0A212SFV9_RHOAC|nr:hypothetical protein [Rhodoblastus acidophilus]SNB84480.1 hypothetical protein SAMN06265338_13612 [Rhodoblastus acidophilus]